jgi:hypothetical protein
MSIYSNVDGQVAYEAADEIDLEGFQIGHAPRFEETANTKYASAEERTEIAVRKLDMLSAVVNRGRRHARAVQRISEEYGAPANTLVSAIVTTTLGVAKQAADDLDS